MSNSERLLGTAALDDVGSAARPSLYEGLSEYGQYWARQPDILTAGPVVIPLMILSGLQNGLHFFI